MRLIDIVNGPWAITPKMLVEIQAIYGRHMRGEKIDIPSLEASIGQPLNNVHKGYEVVDGVAVLPIDGVIAKKMNLFSKISGGVSSELVARDFTDAMNDRKVEAIVLAMDSPGGTVDGTPELAELIYNSRGVKPIYGYSDGMMASAMYWIGSAVDHINISSDVVQVGSIGVVAAHVDVSQAEEKMGVKTTEIAAGKYKRVASRYAPLTEEGRESIQASVDHIYSVFVEDVAKHRGASVEEVLSGMADGRDFFGRQAIEAGLVDGVATLAETIEQARAAARGKTKLRGAGAASAKEKHMDLETLKKDHADLVQAITIEAQAGMEEAINKATGEALEKGAENERQRIADVRAQLIPGHEELVEKLAFDGKTTGPEAAQAIVAAEKSARETAAKSMDTDANQVVEPVNSDAANGPKQMKRADFNKLGYAARKAHLKTGGTIVD